MRAFVLLSLATGLAACGGGGGDTRGGTTANRIGDADEHLGPWVRHSHTCLANRTDALWVDDDGTLWTGCGSGTRGEGLHRSTDGGATWHNPPSPGNVLQVMRINDIWRAEDGVLYASGTTAGGSNRVRVVAIEGDVADAFYMAPDSGAQPWQTFQVTGFRVDVAGHRAVASNAGGHDIIYWPDMNDDGTNGYGWWDGTDFTSTRTIDLEIHDGRFYGTGSSIIQPPMFYYEPEEGMGDTYFMEVINLSPDGLGSFNGEAWSLGIDAQGNMVVAGVNQGSNTAVVWYNNGDPRDRSDWVFVDLTPVIPDTSANMTRFYGACRDGDLIVAVGDYSQRETALLFASTDAGQTWNMFNPPGRGADAVGPLNRCQIKDNKVYVAGAQGYLGVLDATAL